MTTYEKVLQLKQNGVSISYIAKVAKCSPSTINNWLRGATSLSLRLEEDINDAIRKIKEAIMEVE